MTMYLDTVDRLAVCVELYSSSEEDAEATKDLHNVEEITNIRDRLTMLRNWRYHRCIFSDAIKSDRVVYANGVDLTDNVNIDMLLDSAPDIDDPYFDPECFPKSILEMTLHPDTPAPKSVKGYTLDTYRRYSGGRWENHSSSFIDINFINPTLPLTLDFVIERATVDLSSKITFWTEPFDAVRSEITEVLFDGTKTIVWQSEIIEKPENAVPCAFKSREEHFYYMREQIRKLNPGEFL